MNYLLLLAICAICLPSLVLCDKPRLCPNMTLVEKCIRDAEEDWEVDRNQKGDPDKPWCCYQWQAYDCQIDLWHKCPKSWDKTSYNISMTALKTDLDKRCKDWPDDKCHGLKWWAITLIVIGSLAAIAIIGFLLFVLIIKRRNGRRYSAPKG